VPAWGARNLQASELDQDEEAGDDWLIPTIDLVLKRLGQCK
jgi:hypothetical protein